MCRCNVCFVFLSGFSLTNIHDSQSSRERRSYNSALPLKATSQTLRHQLSNYCRELTSGRTQRPDSNREPLNSERKLLTTKLRVLRNECKKCAKSKSNHQQVFYKQVFSKVSQIYTCAGVSFLKVTAPACTLIENETLAQVFSCEFNKIFKNNYFIKYLMANAF